MQTGKTAEKYFQIYNILYRKTDRDHTITVPDLIAELESSSIPADRRSVYTALNAMKQAGLPLKQTQKTGRNTSFWLDHSLSSGEAMLLIDAVQQSPSLSPSVTKEITAHIKSVLSDPEQKLLKEEKPVSGKTDNNDTLKNIQTLLNAIHGLHPVEFSYYDLTVTKQKKYRRNREKYHLIPYAILSSNNRYYCVCWNEKYRDFAIYRIDKMDHCNMLEETVDPVRFDEESWLRSSFDMYKGDPVTIVIEFDLSMVNIVFDQFGKDIIITKVSDHSFTAAIRTAVTPPLVSWLLQFYDRMKVLKPSSLIDELKKIAESIDQTYNNGKKEA